MQSPMAASEVNDGNLVNKTLVTPVVNTISLVLKPLPQIDTLKSISRCVCETIYSFTMCKLIIDLFTVSLSFITKTHPAFKAILALALYLFRRIPVTYVFRSTNYCLGLHKGLQLLTASDFCKDLRSQAYYGMYHLTYSEDLQHSWCLGEQQGIDYRPLFKYFLERTRYHITQFLCTILLIGLLILLTWIRWEWTTVTKPFIPGGSWRVFYRQFFNRPSSKDIEASLQQLAAEKDLMHKKELAKVQMSFNTKLEVMEFEFRIKEDTRDAEVEYVIEGLESDLKEQQRATSQWKLKAMTRCKNCSNIRYRSACKDCRLVKGQLQECELGYERTIAEIEQRHQEALKQALSQRSKALPSITKITSQPSTEEQALRQRIHDLQDQIKVGIANSDFRLKANSKAAKEQLEKVQTKNADLEAEVFRLEGMIKVMKTDVEQAVNCKAELATRATMQEQRAQEIATFEAHLRQREYDLNVREADGYLAASETTPIWQENEIYKAECENLKQKCTALEQENALYKTECEDSKKKCIALDEENIWFMAERELLNENCTALEEEKALYTTESEDLKKKYTRLEEKGRRDIALLGQLEIQNGLLNGRLKQALDARDSLSREIGRLRHGPENGMDETSGNEWVQRASEAEVLVKSQELQIKKLEYRVRDLERNGIGKNPVPLPQPREKKPLRTSNIPGTSAASSTAPNATKCDTPERREFAHMDENKVRKEVASYSRHALDSVLQWNKECMTGSAGAERVVRNFSNLLANWEYLQEDMIRDDKLLRAVKRIVATEGAWKTNPSVVETKAGREPARDRMVKVAELIRARIEGPGQADGGKGVKRMR